MFKDSSMIMSMFSSFDALFLESFGQKVGFSWPLVSTKDDRTSLSLLENKEKSCSNSSADKLNVKKIPENQEVQQKSRKTTSTRFALELDGVHCFESIIPY